MSARPSCPPVPSVMSNLRSVHIFTRSRTIVYGSLMDSWSWRRVSRLLTYMSLSNKPISSSPSMPVDRMSWGSIGSRWIKASSRSRVMAPIATRHSPRRPPFCAWCSSARPISSGKINLPRISKSPNRNELPMLASRARMGRGIGLLYGIRFKAMREMFAFQLKPGTGLGTQYSTSDAISSGVRFIWSAAKALLRRSLTASCCPRAEQPRLRPLLEN